MRTPAVMLAPLVVAVAIAVVTSADPRAVAQSTSPAAQFIDFAGSSSTTLPANLIAAQFGSDRKPTFRLTTRSGVRVLVDDGGSGEDVLYVKTSSPASSLEESFTFRYASENSIAEPIFVNAKRTTLEGLWTNLSASAPGNNGAGNISYRFRDEAGKLQNEFKGRLRTEPYFYRVGHTYRVEAIADDSTGLLTTRIYDLSLGAQTFDLRIKTLHHDVQLYPGIFFHRGSVAILNLSYGPSGSLPIQPHASRAARDYMNYLGYNASIAGPTTTIASQAFQKYFPLLLIKHVRVPSKVRFLPSLNAVAPYGINAMVLIARETTLAQLKSFVAQLKLAPDSLELWNEPNNPSMGDGYDPQLRANLPTYAEQLPHEFPGLTIWGPSVLALSGGGYPSEAIALSKTVGPYISGWNAHTYTLSQPETLGYGGFFGNACGPTQKEDCGWYGATNYNDNVNAVINPALPGITSEGAASYPSYPSICTQTTVDLATQQAYVQRGMLYNYKLGHVRIFPYKFIDDGGCRTGGAAYGIMYRRGEGDAMVISPKPAYVGLVNFDHLLADTTTGTARSNVTPLSYAIAGSTPDIEELLLGQSDGTYRLILWSDLELWDFNAHGTNRPGLPKPTSKTTVTVKFAHRMSAAIYTQIPGNGIWKKSATANAAVDIPVSVDQYPTVIVLGKSVGQVSKELLPASVPTADPAPLR